MNKMMTMVFFFVKLLVPVPSWSPIPNLFAFLFVDTKKKDISVPTSQSIFPPLASEVDHRPQNVPEIEECQPTKVKIIQKLVFFTRCTRTRVTARKTSLIWCQFSFLKLGLSSGSVPGIGLLFLFLAFFLFSLVLLSSWSSFPFLGFLLFSCLVEGLLPSSPPTHSTFMRTYNYKMGRHQPPWSWECREGKIGQKIRQAPQAGGCAIHR